MASSAQLSLASNDETDSIEHPTIQHHRRRIIEDSDNDEEFEFQDDVIEPSSEEDDDDTVVASTPPKPLTGAKLWAKLSRDNELEDSSSDDDDIDSDLAARFKKKLSILDAVHDSSDTKSTGTRSPFQMKTVPEPLVENDSSLSSFDESDLPPKKRFVVRMRNECSNTTTESEQEIMADLKHPWIWNSSRDEVSWETNDKDSCNENCGASLPHFCIPGKLFRMLYQYQVEGVQWMGGLFESGGVLGDDMGMVGCSFCLLSDLQDSDLTSGSLCTLVQ